MPGLLMQVTHAERQTDGRTKTQLTLQTVCPSLAAFRSPAPPLALAGESHN